VNAAYQRIEYWKIARRPIRSAVRPSRSEPPEPGEDRRDETHEQDLHRDERPRRSGDQNRLTVEAREAALTEDVLDVLCDGYRGLECRRRHLRLGLRL